MSVRKASLLDASFVLAPERYDPRRDISSDAGTVPLSEIAISIRKTVDSTQGLGPCLVLDTSDAREGLVICRKDHAIDIGSTKKVFQFGDVIISRLRPYLRQVAFIDSTIPASTDAALLCSTEFFVLRSTDHQSIAFLVPFLLSAQIQRVLAASQEGGHHPRFRESALLTLPLPASVLETRREISSAVERVADLYRQSEREFRLLVGKVEQSLPEWRCGVVPLAR